MKEFVIPFFGLKVGFHKFDFEIGRPFFEAFENTLVEDGNFSVKLELEKLSNMLVLKFKAKGIIEDFCDRCGDPLSVKCKAKDKVFVKFGEESFEQTDDIIILNHDAHEINVAQLIYEMIVLNIPGKKVHAGFDDCNQEVLRKLEEKMTPKDDKEDTDPRWEALKKLK